MVEVVAGAATEVDSTCQPLEALALASMLCCVAATGTEGEAVTVIDLSMYMKTIAGAPAKPSYCMASAMRPVCPCSCTIFLCVYVTSNHICIYISVYTTRDSAIFVLCCSRNGDMADAASSQNGSALPAGTALREMPPEEREAFRQQLDALGISSTSKHHPVPQSGSGLTGAEAGSPHARAGTTHALKFNVHRTGKASTSEGPEISLGQLVSNIVDHIVSHLETFKRAKIDCELDDIALRALWLPGDVPELNEEAEVTQVQVEGTQYDAVKLRVRAAAPRNKW